MAKTTETTVTTTVTTTTKTTTRKSKGFWGTLKTWAKALIILGAILLLALAAVFILFARAEGKSNTMESTIPANTRVVISRFANPEVGDVILFYHPEADSVVPSSPDKNYYKMSRMYGKAWCNKAEVVYQNKKKRPIYASRCVGGPNDIVAIKNNTIIVNNTKFEDPEGAKYPYVVVSNGYLAPSVLDSLGLTKESMNGEEDNPEACLGYYRNLVSADSKMAIYCLTDESAKKMQALPVVPTVQKVVLPAEHFDATVFPYMESLHWNQSNFGPVLIPAKGKVLKLDVRTLPIYRRCIEAYEGNTVDIQGNTIFINGKVATSYKFKKDYYFVIGDNRSSKDDSRFFGFLPENHIVGVKF